MRDLDYQRWLVEGMLSVIPKVLKVVAEHGLAEGHALYVSFHTNHPEAEISSALRTNYPERMTIVLEHQFWDLVVSEQGFSVVLAFGGVRESLFVPWQSVYGFADPAAEFGFETTAEGGLQLQSSVESDDSTPEEGQEAAGDGEASPTLVSPFEAKNPIQSSSDDAEEEKLDHHPAGKVVPFERPEEE